MSRTFTEVDAQEPLERAARCVVRAGALLALGVALLRCEHWRTAIYGLACLVEAEAEMRRGRVAIEEGAELLGVEKGGFVS